MHYTETEDNGGFNNVFWHGKKEEFFNHVSSSSVADPGCLSRIPDPDFYPSRIPDPKTVTKEKGEEKNLLYFFL